MTIWIKQRKKTMIKKKAIRRENDTKSQRSKNENEISVKKHFEWLNIDCEESRNQSINQSNSGWQIICSSSWVKFRMNLWMELRRHVLLHTTSTWKTALSSTMVTKHFSFSFSFNFLSLLISSFSFSLPFTFFNSLLCISLLQFCSFSPPLFKSFTFFPSWFLLKISIFLFIYSVLFFLIVSF